MLGLRPNVTQPEALAAFRAASPSNFYWRATRGPLQRLALAYVPFVLYRATYELGSARNTRLFAIDRVEGILDLFEFPSEPAPEQFAEIATRNRIAPSLGEAQTETLVRDKILRVIFQQGFFRVRHTHLAVQRLPLDLNMPYWLAFYGADGHLRCRVMDAVRRRMEGPKSTHLFECWLSLPARSNAQPVAI